jgi:hypothetical protein
MFSVAIVSQQGGIKYQTLMKLGGDNCTANKRFKHVTVCFLLQSGDGLCGQHTEGECQQGGGQGAPPHVQRGQGALERRGREAVVFHAESRLAP